MADIPWEREATNCARKILRNHAAELIGEAERVAQRLKAGAVSVDYVRLVCLEEVSAGPFAVPPGTEPDRLADPRRDGPGVPDVQRQARPGQAGAELLTAQEAGQPAGPDSSSTAFVVVICSSDRTTAAIMPARGELYVKTGSSALLSRASPTVPTEGVSLAGSRV
jgi:hypothetical protein